jgi:hypothetical protein
VDFDDMLRAYSDMTRYSRSDLAKTTIFIDARPATSYASRAYWAHCGQHPVIIEEVAKHAAHHSWWNNLRYNLNRVATLAGKMSLTVVCYCKQGKHRSVAMAYLVHHVLSRSREYVPEMPVAFIPWSQLCRCGGPDRCAECGTTQDPAYIRALDLSMQQFFYGHIPHKRPE